MAMLGGHVGLENSVFGCAIKLVLVAGSLRIGQHVRVLSSSLKKRLKIKIYIYYTSIWCTLGLRTQLAKAWGGCGSSVVTFSIDGGNIYLLVSQLLLVGKEVKYGNMLLVAWHTSW